MRGRVRAGVPWCCCKAGRRSTGRVELKVGVGRLDVGAPSRSMVGQGAGDLLGPEVWWEGPTGSCPTAFPLGFLLWALAWAAPDR